MRLNKFLAVSGICSRREADHLIQQGWISVNGEPVAPNGQKVQVGDDIQVSPKANAWLDKKITLVIHKPPGYVSNLAEDGHKHIMDLVTRENYFGDKDIIKVPQKGFAPAGRLDIDSSGLLLLTQDGTLAKKVIQENSFVEKEYIVKVEGLISEEKIAKLASGTLTIDGQPLRKAQVKRLNETQMRFILKEGKKRQIRKMCEACGLQVKTLKRVRIGSLGLGPLPRGKWRFLAPDELI